MNCKMERQERALEEKKKQPYISQIGGAGQEEAI